MDVVCVVFDVDVVFGADRGEREGTEEGEVWGFFFFFFLHPAPNLLNRVNK